MTDGRTDGWIDGGVHNIPIAFLKRRGNSNNNDINYYYNE